MVAFRQVIRCGYVVEMREIADPNLVHQIRVMMADNAHIFITCNCIYRAMTTLDRKKRARVKRTLKEYGSLGEFPLDAPIRQIREVYNEHLRQVELDE